MSNFLIAGLGNIGEEYVETRHNIGFKIVEALAAQHKADFRLDKLAYVAQFRFKGKNITLIKPTTYMNLSGKAVRYWMQEANVKPENMLAILDDLAIPFGTIRLRPKGSDGGHNGLKDIDATLGNNLYPRLRFGIGSNYHKGQQVNYVLGKWSAEENKDLIDKIILATQATESFLFEGLGNAMTKFNK
jgi:PTH1 family peptidyl-tRNA hydrolase